MTQGPLFYPQSFKDFEQTVLICPKSSVSRCQNELTTNNIIDDNFKLDNRPSFVANPALHIFIGELGYLMLKI